MSDPRVIGFAVALFLSLAAPVSSWGDEAASAPSVDIELPLEPHREPNSDLAAALALEGKLDEALAVYAEVLAENPEQRDAIFGRARVLGWLGRYDESLAVLDGTLADSPDDVEALVLRARVLGWTERYESGEADARHALSLAPDSVEAHIVLGDLLTWSQRGGEAKAEYEEALRIAPDSGEAEEGLRRLLGGSLPGEASPHARRLRADFGLRFDSLDGGSSDWWQEDLHIAFQALPRLRLYTGLTQTRRYDLHDTQASVGVSWAGRDGWWLGAGAVFGPDADVVARYVVSVEAAGRVAEPVVLKISYRRSWYAGSVETDALTPGVEFWLGDKAKLLGRYHFTRLSGGRLGHAGSLRAELFPQGRLIPYAAVGYGTEAFAPSTVQSARTRARNISASGGLVWKFRDGFGLRLGYAFEDLDRTYRRHGLEAGLFGEF
jgi:YaiO family outer membrane protein